MKSKQIGGTHYQSNMECWDYILANDLGYLEGTAIKYLTRWKKKNGVEDLYKAIHFIEKLIETQSKDITHVMRDWARDEALKEITDFLEGKEEKDKYEDRTTIRPFS